MDDLLHVFLLLVDVVSLQKDVDSWTHRTNIIFLAITAKSLAHFLEVEHLNSNIALLAVWKEIIDVAEDHLGRIELITISKSQFVLIHFVQKFLHDLVFNE